MLFYQRRSINSTIVMIGPDRTIGSNNGRGWHRNPTPLPRKDTNIPKVCPLYAAGCFKAGKCKGSKHRVGKPSLRIRRHHRKRITLNPPPDTRIHLRPCLTHQTIKLILVIMRRTQWRLQWFVTQTVHLSHSLLGHPIVKAR